MHGVPFILYTDKGCANTSGLFKNLLERLDVTFIPHATGNSRAKGQVENGNNIVETQFEGRLRFIKIESLEQLKPSLVLKMRSIATFLKVLLAKTVQNF